MPLQIDYQLTVEFETENGITDSYPLHTVAESFSAAVGDLHFEAIRKNGFEARITPPDSFLAPVWDPSMGEPYVCSFQLELAGCGLQKNYSRDLLIDSVSRASQVAIESGQLEAGEYSRFRIMAYKARKSGQQRLQLEPLDSKLEIINFDVDELQRINDITVDDSDDFDRYVTNNVLEGVEQLARNNPNREVGGMLVGSLVRSCSGDICLLVKDFLEVDGNPSRTSFEFRPQDYVAVDTALELRRRSEQVVGWFHSHPFFCELCPEERRLSCPFRTPVFSRADRDVHKTLFPNSWAIGLLFSNFGARGEFSVYGWRQAMIDELGYQVVEEI